MLKKLILTLISIGWSLNLSAQISSLRKEIQRIVAQTDGKLGVAILDLDGKDSITFNNTYHFPMQSVYKFHLGLVVLRGVDQGRWKLDQEIFITKEDLLPNTWSPLRDKYPDGNVKLPLRDILKFTVADSDNNGCDILFRLVGGPQEVEKYLRSIGIKEIAVATTEEEMHRDAKAQFRNWSTPWGAAQLLQKFYQRKLLNPDTQQFMWNTLVSTTTGTRKLKGMLPKDAIVAHKTGWSGSDKNGHTAATNDIGIFQLPNGKHIAVVTFLADTNAKEEVNEKVMASVGKTVWDYFSK